MKKQITRFAALAVATVIGITPTVAQDVTREREQELEERLRALREQMREIERELGRSNWVFSDGITIDGAFPRVLSLSRNRAQLGVLVQTRADRDTDAIGAVLESVTPGTPADEAGLEGGDIITAFNGVRLTGANPDADPGESGPALRLIEMVRELDEGEEVAIEYERNGDTRTTTATLRHLEDSSGFAFTTRSGGPDDNFFDVRVAPRVTQIPRVEMVRGGGNAFVTTFFSGMWADIELVSLNEDLGQYFGTSEGLLVIQAPEGSEVDLRGGDVILDIDGRDPRSPSRALRILRSYESGEEMTLRIMRDRATMEVTVTVPESGSWGRLQRRERR